MKRILNCVKQFLRKMILGPKSSSEAFVRYLRDHGSKIGEGVYFYDPRSTVVDSVRMDWITIGAYTKISVGVTILAHDYSPSVLVGTHHKILLPGGNDTVIGSNCFIGAKAIILSGKKIGDHCIVAAGSVVTKNIPPYSVCAGNPAKVIMTIDEYYEKCNCNYLEAAARNVRHFHSVYGRFPETKELYGFALLYLERTEHNYNLYFSNYITHDNKKEDVEKAFWETSPYFDSYEDFMKYCFSLDQTVVKQK